VGTPHSLTGALSTVSLVVDNVFLFTVVVVIVPRVSGSQGGSPNLFQMCSTVSEWKVFHFTVVTVIQTLYDTGHDTWPHQTPVLFWQGSHGSYPVGTHHSLTGALWSLVVDKVFHFTVVVVILPRVPGSQGVSTILFHVSRSVRVEGVPLHCVTC